MIFFFFFFFLLKFQFSLLSKSVISLSSGFTDHMFKKIILYLFGGNKGTEIGHLKKFLPHPFYNMSYAATCCFFFVGRGLSHRASLLYFMLLSNPAHLSKKCNQEGVNIYIVQNYWLISKSLLYFCGICISTAAI